MRVTRKRLSVILPCIHILYTYIYIYICIYIYIYIYIYVCMCGCVCVCTRACVINNECEQCTIYIILIIDILILLPYYSLCYNTYLFLYYISLFVMIIANSRDSKIAYPFTYSYTLFSYTI